MTHRTNSVLLLLLFLLCGNLQAGPNLLSNNWKSCFDGGRTRITGATFVVNSECLYQEVDARQNDNLNLVCQTTASNFTSAELSYANQNSNTLRSATDTTFVNTTLRVNLGNAPRNTRHAIVSLNADGRSTFNCTLSTPDNPQTNNTSNGSGACIDTDGDGFGWNGFATCRPSGTQQAQASQQVAVPTASAECIDSDGDGFGWNGFATCLVGAATQNNSRPSNSAGAAAGACVDPDGDGFGWNGVATCIVSGSSNSGSSGNLGNQASNAPVFSDLTDLILVTGQSNAQGGVTSVSLAVLDRPNNKVFAFTDDDGWQVADLRQHWDGPNQRNRPGNNALNFPGNQPRNNFALHFGRSLVETDSSRVVGFVLATAPGEGIRFWDRGGRFYNSVRNKAMTALRASNKVSFDGVLWHQGETDFQFSGTSDVRATAAERNAANYYPDRLNSLIRNLRQEPWFTTKKPVFICGETQTTSSDRSKIAPVNRRLMALNSDNDPYTACVSSNGLQTTDGVHFNAAALRQIGRRYANKYLELKRN